MAGRSFVPYGSGEYGGRFFGETKGLALRKQAGTESWVGSGLLGGLPVSVEILPAGEGEKRVKFECPMWALSGSDILRKVGTLWTGEFCFIKSATDGTKWLNLKTNKSLVGDAEGDW